MTVIEVKVIDRKWESMYQRHFKKVPCSLMFVALYTTQHRNMLLFFSMSDSTCWIQVK